jgi:hypothetical protein
MTKNCKQCQRTFEVTEDDLKFYDKVSPIFPPSVGAGGGKKYQIPPPTLCPEFRMKLQMSF